ncbi:MAG: aminoglycoside phosphotransferase family protein [Chlamydiota bacterium]
MLTKPDLKNEKIIACLHDNYGLDVAEISFLPLGADFNTAVYRVSTIDKTDYFLKLRSGDFCEPSVLIPHHLKQIGMQNIIPPIATKTDECWTNLDAFKVALYPYIDGRNAVDMKLSEQQWQQFGRTVKKLHTADIPESIISNVPKETFSLKFCQTVRLFLERTQNEVFDEAVATKLAALLKSKNKIIFDLIKRTEELGSILQNQSLQHVLCHADMHGWNLLVDQNNRLYLIDWDTLILAPKERDLMFIGAGIWDSGYTPTEEESLFYKGYGQGNINQDTFCYYRFNRILQDIAEYCEYIFLSDEGGDDRMEVLEHLKPNFLPNGTVERAYHADKMRGIS